MITSFTESVVEQIALAQPDISARERFDRQAHVEALNAARGAAANEFLEEQGEA